MGNVPWDGMGINCYGIGMEQINMSHGQPWKPGNNNYVFQHVSEMRVSDVTYIYYVYMSSDGPQKRDSLF